MQVLSEATRRYIEPPSCDRFKRDRVHLAVTKSADQTLSHFVTDFYNPQDWAPEGKRMPCMSTLKWAQGFPEFKRVDKIYNTFRLELPATDMVVERIDNSFESDHITFEDFDTELTYRGILLRGQQADINARQYAEYKELKKVPEHSLDHSEQYPLACYQQVALVNSWSTPGYGLFMEQGTGKTPVCIARICNDAKALDRMYRALIVCPKNVRANWESEFRKFATVGGKVTILHGSANDRTKQLLEAMIEEDGCEYSAVLCSYESMSRSWNSIQYIVSSLPDGKWDLGLLDESHYIKNEQTKRYKHAKLLRDLAKNRTVLTGTPITNNALDLYTQLEFLGQGYSGFHSFKAFRKFFGRYRLDQASGREVLEGMQNLPFMKERLARYSFFVRSAEVQPELPDRVYDILEVEMSDEQRKLYEQLRDQLALEVEADLLSQTMSKKMVINNVLTKLLKLSQITSGFITWPPVLDDDGNEVSPSTTDRIDPDGKLETLVQLIKTSDENSKIIVWANWVQCIKTIRARMELEEIDSVVFYGATNDEDRKSAVQRFNCDPNCKVFIGNPGCAGEGVNLLGYPPAGDPIYAETGKTPDDWETNANRVFYYSQDWSSVKRSQSEKRAHRRGTREPVRVTDLTVPGTIDAEIREVVLNKQINALEISDLKNILNSVLTGDLVSD